MATTKAELLVENEQLRVMLADACRVSTAWETECKRAKRDIVKFRHGGEVSSAPAQAPAPVASERADFARRYCAEKNCNSVTSTHLDAYIKSMDVPGEAADSL